MARIVAVDALVVTASSLRGRQAEPLPPDFLSPAVQLQITALLDERPLVLCGGGGEEAERLRTGFVAPLDERLLLALHTEVYHLWLGLLERFLR